MIGCLLIDVYCSDEIKNEADYNFNHANDSIIENFYRKFEFIHHQNPV